MTVMDIHSILICKKEEKISRYKMLLRDKIAFLDDTISNLSEC